MSTRRKRQKISQDGLAFEAGVQSDSKGGNATNLTQDPAETTSAPKLRTNSLFVRSLPPTATSESLTELFSQSYPLKHATVVLDPVTKKSRGFGFVTFTDPEDAARAREEFNGTKLEGKRIVIDVAEPRHRDTTTGALGQQKTSQPSAAARKARDDREAARLEAYKPPKLIIRNLPWSIKTSDELAALFRSYGKVKFAELPKKKPGLSPGFGFVTLRGRANAEKALAGINGKVVDGRTLAVDWAVDKEVWQASQKPEDRTEGDDVDDSVKSEDDNEELRIEDVPPSDVDHDLNASEDDESEDWDDEELDDDDNLDEKDEDEDEEEEESVKLGETKSRVTDNSTTLFIRNLPFTTTDTSLQEHFKQFGAVRYARVVMDPATERSRGTAFVCFYNAEDAIKCLREAPKPQLGPNAGKSGAMRGAAQRSLLEDTHLDESGLFTIDGRVLHVSHAVDRNEAHRLTVEGSSLREKRDRDKRRLYLLSEGTIPSNSPLYATLPPSEAKLREESAKQRQTLIKSNPSLHLSLTRLSIRNLPRSVTSKELKALARQACVEFAKEVKEGKRKPLSKEELSRGGQDMKDAERARKVKGKGIVSQAKVVFEGRDGSKVGEHSGAGRSRCYGFLEYSSHRWALMGLRWLNGHAVSGSIETAKPGAGPVKEKAKRLIVEFAIENAQVVARRREQEQKARDRSKIVAEKRAAGEIVESPKKPLPKDTVMANARRGQKRKREGQQTPGNAESGVANDPKASEKQAQRQRIIGKKRMIRKSRPKK